MAELKQRRWFKKKTFSLTPDHEVLITEVWPFGGSVKKFRLFDLHPFYERYQNNALGYFLAACLLLVLGVSYSWVGACGTDCHLSVLLPVVVLLSCSAVTFFLYAVNRIAKFEFFHRSNGKQSFYLWSTLRGHSKATQFAEELSGLIKTAHDQRFITARQVINPVLRYGASEEAIHTLFRLGVLDFAELETLLANAHRKYNSSGLSKDLRNKSRKNNIVDMSQYRRKKESETHA